MQRVYGTKIRASRFFRRDGKAASAFNSLNRVVNIARLSSRIVDASLRKSANLASALEIGQSSPESADLSPWEQGIEELLRERLILSAESTAAERRFDAPFHRFVFTRSRNNFAEWRFGKPILRCPFLFGRDTGIFLEVTALLQEKRGSFCGRDFFISTK